jgi:uncharacterized RmlC-like cupin family protein
MGVKIVRPEDRDCTTAQTTGMQREAGISPQTVGSTTLWTGWVSTPPATASGVHHHGDCESSIYVIKGRIRFSWGPKLEHSAEAGPGDFLFVPPNEIHMEENLSTTEPVELLVSRGCTEMLVVNVPDPREGNGQ